MKDERLTIRIGADELIISMKSPQTENGMQTERYVLNKSISAAANLRDAFTTSALLQGGSTNALLLIDSDIMLIPLEEHQTDTDIETLYRHSFTLRTGEQLQSNIIQNLNVAAVFSVNKDLKMVVEDHFPDVSIMSVMEPVWQHTYKRAFSGVRTKLFAYFHDKQVSIFCFAHNRFRFNNTFAATYTDDAIYYILNVWKQLGLSAADDELHIIKGPEALIQELKQYVARIYEEGDDPKPLNH